MAMCLTPCEGICRDESVDEEKSLHEYVAERGKRGGKPSQRTGRSVNEQTARDPRDTNGPILDRRNARHHQTKEAPLERDGVNRTQEG